MGVLPAPLASAFRRKAHVGESAEGLVAPAVYAELAAWLLVHAPAQFNGALVDARQVPAASH